MAAPTNESAIDAGTATLVIHPLPNETTVVRPQEGGGFAINLQQQQQADPTDRTPLIDQPHRHGNRERLGDLRQGVEEQGPEQDISCCDKLCRPFCLPCSSRAVAALLQVLSLLLILALLGVTVYGPILCKDDEDSDIRLTGAISLVAPVMMLLVVMTCFITNCVCANGRGNRQTRAILYVFCFLFCLAFILAVAAESYFVYQDQEFIEKSFKQDKKYCKFSMIVAVNVFISYAVILLAFIAWVVSLIYVACSGSKRNNERNERRIKELD